MKGEHTFTCTVTDSYGLDSSDDVTIVAFEPNTIPVAALTVTEEDILSGHESGAVDVTLNGCESSDGDGDSISYHFVDASGDEEVELSVLPVNSY